ncbi:MAG: hypothetical protein JJT78_16660, partial [Leptospira sp.]|nr:hypothetical protein [Leptospira sp.]
RIVLTQPRSTNCEENNSICFEYCQIDSGLESIQAVKNSQKVADSSDFKNKGCGSFAWNHASKINDFTTWGD